MRDMIVLRGVPGSGKSELANLLISLTAMRDGMTYGSEAVICSADQFFHTSVGAGSTDGSYKFDPKKLGAAHNWCKNKAYNACHLGTELVIIDNTNTQRWEFQPYMDMAKEFDYRIRVIEVQGDHQNQHGVGPEKVNQMRARMEHDWYNADPRAPWDRK